MPRTLCEFMITIRKKYRVKNNRFLTKIIKDILLLLYKVRFKGLESTIHSKKNWRTIEKMKKI